MRNIPMTIDEYFLLPFEPGWKCEYWDGAAHYSPRHHFVVTTADIIIRTPNTNYPLRRPTESDTESLIKAYTSAFQETIEYFGYTKEQVAEGAKKDLRKYFSGTHGQPSSASFVAIAPSPTQEEAIIGAALITLTKAGPRLDLLFVTPPWQRRGLATAMVSASINELHNQKEKTLTSAYHIGNEESMAWHQRFGFVEMPDLVRANLYLQKARHELWRQEKLSRLSTTERNTLTNEIKRWEAEVEELERMERQDGFDAVHPQQRWFRS